MINYDLNRLKHRVQFGTIKSVENDNTGDYSEQFVPQVTCWCGMYTQTQTQQYTLMGNDQQDLITIAIRHNSAVKESLIAKLNGVQYNVAAINSDDQLGAFDTVTLKKVTKA